MEEIDAILYVIDASRKPGTEEQELIDIVKNHRRILCIAINKIDIAPDGAEEYSRYLKEQLEPGHLHRISASYKTGLEKLIDSLITLAPEGERMYPDEIYTDQEPEFRAAEIIREKAINRVHQELPHSIYVEISDMELHDKGNTLWIRAFINVERESQKGMLVGKGGDRIKAIRRSALKDLRELFPYKVELDVRVKVSREWRKNSGVLRKLIH